MTVGVEFTLALKHHKKVVTLNSFQGLLQMKTNTNNRFGIKPPRTERGHRFHGGIFGKKIVSDLSSKTKMSIISANATHYSLPKAQRTKYLS